MVKKISVISLLGFISFWMAGCKAKEKVYRLAIAVPLTGDIAAMGQGMRRGAQLAVDEANESGKFKYKIELAAFDDRADPKEAVNVANQIAADPHIFAVVGHLNSGCSIPAAQVYAKNNLLMVTPAATNPKVTSQQAEPSWKWVKNIFRVTPTDDVQAKFAAEFVSRKLKLRTVCIIHDKTPYGQGLAEEFQKQFAEQGGRIVSFDGIAVGDKDFKALLTRIKSQNPDLIYFGGLYNEGGLIVKQAREIGLQSIFLSGAGMFIMEYIKIAGNASEGSYITSIGVPPERIPTAKIFIEKYNQKYPGIDMEPFDHYTYETAGMAIYALEQAGIEDNPAKVNKSKIIEFMRTVKYDGILGRTEFDERGETQNKAISIYWVKNGKFAALN